MKCIIGEKIFELRKENDFWEKGINEPKASYIISIAKYFGVTADYLLGLEIWYSIIKYINTLLINLNNYNLCITNI